jgi:hypothetical protein
VVRCYVLSYLKAHGCVDCPEKDPIVLDFDHVSGTKIESISRMTYQGTSLDTIKLEMEKCEVRCANCHRRKTAIQLGRYKDIDLSTL